MKTFLDDFGNRATLEEKRILPYRGAAQKEPAFILSCYADYDGKFMYFRSVFDTEKAALAVLETYSSGTFKAVTDTNI